jgi:hypothetical protein
MGSYKPKRVRYIPEPDKKGAVIDLWGHPGNGILTDRSGNSNDGAVSGRVDISQKVSDVVWRAYGAGNPAIVISDSATIQNNPQQTFQFMTNPRSIGESSGGRFLAKSGRYFAFYNTAASNSFEFWQDFSGATGRWRIPIPIGKNSFFQMTYDKSSNANDPVGYINGHSVIVTQVANPTGTYTSDAGDDLYLLNRVGTDRDGDMDMGYFKLYPTILSADDLRDEYVKFALGHVYRPTPRTEKPVTASTVSSPGIVGPWDLLSGSADWTDDGTDRYLERVTNCDAIIHQPHAYGFFSFKMKHSTGDNIAQFISGKRGAWDATGQTGYNVKFDSGDDKVYLYEQSGAVSTQVGVSSAVLVDGVTYDVGVARRIATGRFDVYIRGGAITTWTNVLNGIDATHTTSRFFAVDLTANGIIVNPEVWFYGDTLLPNDVPELRD